MRLIYGWKPGANERRATLTHLIGKRLKHTEKVAAYKPASPPCRAATASVDHITKNMVFCKPGAMREAVAQAPALPKKNEI